MNKRRRFKAKAQRRRISREARRLAIGYTRAKVMLADEAHDRRMIARLFDVPDHMLDGLANLSLQELVALSDRCGFVLTSLICQDCRS